MYLRIPTQPLEAVFREQVLLAVGPRPGLLGEDAAGLSPTNITRLTAVWEKEYAAFRQSSLEGREYVYVWVDHHQGAEPVVLEPDVEVHAIPSRAGRKSPVESPRR